MPSAGKAVIGLSLFLSSFPGLAPLRAQPANADAQRVLRIIEKIEKEGSRGPGGASRKEVVSETELNAYIAYRIAFEKEEIMKELRLKLLPRNSVEGKIFIDLSSKRIPGFLKPQMNVYFAGTLETEGPKVRVHVESLFLEEQRIQTALLDMIISVVSRFEKMEPVSIEDWYDLPYGIRKLETRTGELVVSY
jgi:hypothetical protein